MDLKSPQPHNPGSIRSGGGTMRALNKKSIKIFHYLACLSLRIVLQKKTGLNINIYGK